VNHLAVVLHDQVKTNAPPDQVDTLQQVGAVSRALQALGYRVQPLALNLNLSEARNRLRTLNPALVFNLAESVEGDGRFVHLPALLLEAMGLCFTGCSSEALYLTGNKLLCKKRLRGAGLPTPDWRAGDRRPRDGVDDRGSWLVKSVNEEASIGIDAGALVSGHAAVDQRLALAARRYGGAWFAERYVEGREFNVSLLDHANRPMVLPTAEISFRDFPPGMPRIVDYAAKWDAESFGFRHTQRSFAQHTRDAGLRETLSRLARDCWSLFGLRGYARIDFRVDVSGQPWILEVNANPCIAEDAGFVAAAARAGLGLRELVARLVRAASRPANDIP
jgi:D-alanine-D-alanine ligase